MEVKTPHPSQHTPYFNLLYSHWEEIHYLIFGLVHCSACTVHSGELPSTNIMLWQRDGARAQTPIRSLCMEKKRFPLPFVSVLKPVAEEEFDPSVSDPLFFVIMPSVKEAGRVPVFSLL